MAEKKLEKNGPLVWDKVGEKRYETGTDRGVLYTGDSSKPMTGEVWNGLTAVKQAPDGAEATPLFADNIKYLNLTSAENFKGSIEAFMYPESFEECDGTKTLSPGVRVGQQPRKAFGLCYRTLIGNDVVGQDAGYRLHIIYNATAAPSPRDYETINESPSAITFSWSFDTVPVVTTRKDIKPTAYVSIDSTTLDPAKLKTLEETLYGSGVKPATLPPLDDLLKLIVTE